MKVLLMASIDFPVSRKLKHAGIQRVVLALAEELQSLGIEVTVCCSGDSDELGGAQFTTVERALHGARPVVGTGTDPWAVAPDISSEIILEGSYTNEEHERHFALSLNRALSEGADIVNDHGGGLLLSDAYLRSEGVLRMPILSTLHGAVTADGHREECAAYRERGRPNVFFSCVSRHQAELWAQHISISGAVHNGIFVDDYHFQSQKNDYLFNLGRIMRRKGQDVAVEVAQRAGLKLVLAGPIMEPEYFDQFRSRVRLMPQIGAIPVTASYFADVVEPVLASPEPAVYIGQLDDAQKDVWFGHARCFLMPISWDEPFPLVLLEAMACGTPVLTFNRGGVSESVVDKKTGFIVDTVDEMVEAINKVDRIDPLECRRHVEHHFSSRAMGMKYLELYKQLLSST
ncbi:MAG: glycosyltransferase [Chloroflexi bacterium]|nr:glycosyltransferase [Chloroflexota bacterium]